jgi:single-strand DNA-binding protein
MFNKVILMGRICHDLELKTTPAGVSVCSFRVAVDRNYQVKGEERKADFFNIVAWRSTAEFVSKYFGKGRMILVDGELQTRQYVDNKTNATVNVVEVVADSVKFTGEKANDNNTPRDYSQPQGSYQQAQSQSQPQGYGAGAANIAPQQGEFPKYDSVTDDDDYPF